MNLKPYPVMKDSGVEWLGQVPKHWRVEPGRCVLQTKSVANTGLRETRVLSLSYGRIIVKPEEKLRGLVPESFETYQIVDPSDIIIRSTDLQNDRTSLRVGYVHDRGIITSAYMCLHPLRDLTNDYGYQLLNTYDLSKVLYGFGSGLRQNLGWNDFKYMPILVPPVEEQDAIVRFIDYVDRRIRRYIRAKRKLVKLLEEQKQAIIHQAVTGGLDPDVPLKDSGVEWLGQVPEHWEVTRVKTEFECLNSRRIPLSSSERGAMTLRRYDYYGASGVIDKVDDYLFDDELLLIAEDGANLVLRNLPLAIVSRGRYWVNNHAHILKPRRGDIEYLAAVMECLDYKPWISGAAQPKLTKDRIMAIAIAVPSPDEQDTIMEWANAETDPIRSAITRANREIELLNEYRTRLIAEVVTGKLDARETAASLPDEADEPESSEDLDEMIEVEMDQADDQDHHDQEHDDE